MTARIFDLANARTRPRPEHESLRFKIAEDGSLEIRPVRPDGIVIPAYVVPDGEVDGLLATLAAARGRLKWKRHYAKHPLDVPAGAPCPRLERRHACRQTPDGGRTTDTVSGGCRRLAGHKGQCRNATGDYTPAICSHIGRARTRIRIAATDETWLTCAHCGARTSP